MNASNYKDKNQLLYNSNYHILTGGYYVITFISESRTILLGKLDNFWRGHRIRSRQGFGLGYCNRAEKYEDSQDVPITISAFSGDALSDLGIVDTGELGQFIPGLEITTSSGEGSQFIVFLRGAGLNDFNTNNAGPIAIYSDEVYISSPVLTSFSFLTLSGLKPPKALKVHFMAAILRAARSNSFQINLRMKLK